MSESGWLQLATLLVGLASMWIGLHFKLKGVEKQGEVQEKKIDNVHDQFNSRLDEWKKQSQEQTAVAVEVALAKGRAEAATAAAELLAMAKEAAENMKKLAEIEARGILAQARQVATTKGSAKENE